MKIRISKSRIAFIAFFWLLLSASQLRAQEQSAAFSADTSKFLTELNEQFQKVGDADAAEAKLILSTFTYQWTSNLLAYTQKKQALFICRALSERKLEVSPYYLLYFKVLTTLVKQNSLPATYDLLHKSVNYCMQSKTPSRTLLRYLTQTDLLLSSNAFMKSNSEAWFVRKGTYKFAFDSVPYFAFASGNLACVVRNDSACIYEA